MPGILGKYVSTPTGPRPHEYGDNTCMVLHAFSKWTGNEDGVEVIAPGWWGG